MSKFLRSCLAIFTLLAANDVRAAQPPIVVVDSVGKTVGSLIGDDVVALRLKPGLPIVKMSVGYDKLGESTVQYHASSDCTGPVYLPKDALIQSAYREATRPDTIIFADLEGPLVSTKSGSLQGTCTLFDFAGYPVRRIKVDDLGFKPPFTVRFR